MRGNLLREKPTRRPVTQGVFDYEGVDLRGPSRDVYTTAKMQGIFTDLGLGHVSAAALLLAVDGDIDTWWDAVVGIIIGLGYDVYLGGLDPEVLVFGSGEEDDE